MRNRLFLLLGTVVPLSAFIFLGISQQAMAQGVLTPQVQAGFLVGPVGGVNIVAYNTTAFATLNEEPSCFQAQNGSGVAPWGGLSLEFPLGNANELQSFIVGEVVYNSQSSNFTSVTGAQSATPTKLNGFVDNNSTVSTALAAQLSYLTVDLAYKYNFTPGPTPIGPGIQVGPSVGIKMASTFNKTVTVSAISPTATADGQAAVQTVTANTAIDQASALRIALRAQFTYDLSFSPDWIATPTAGYDFPITKVDATDRNWRSSAVFAGIYFRYFIRG
jgi:hypothetical protein